jgi:hypothetical protein
MGAEVFFDGVVNIALVKGMVRIEVGSQSISERDENGKPKIINRHQLVLTPQVFLETFSNMESMLNKLIDNGIVKDGSADEQRHGPARDTDAEFSGKDMRASSDRRKRDLSLRS